jgi:predicted DNA-binding helix-hairpin-helix protein
LLEAGRWADRLSANIELPTQADLDSLAPAKSHTEIESSMACIQTGILDAKTFARAGQSTQMIVGATPAPDAQVLSTAATLYRKYGLRRVYYSAFSPFPHADSRLPVNRAPLVREHRLYQADWLLRYYGFTIADVTEQEYLPLDMDPKLAWALRHREFFPVDVNRAPMSALLRVPGFGVRNVKRIVSARRHRSITLDDLRKLRIPVARAKYFVTTSERNGATRAIDSISLPLRMPRQASLFDATVRGEL